MVLAGFPEVTQALIALTLGDEVGRALFLSGSIATVVVGLLLFYIGFDKIRQKQLMEVLGGRWRSRKAQALPGPTLLAEPPQDAQTAKCVPRVDPLRYAPAESDLDVL